MQRVYSNAVHEQLQEEEEARLREIELKTYSVKYLGITDGKIGILSRKLPIGYSDKEKQVKRPATQP